jgi:hypothetical protein
MTLARENRVLQLRGWAFVDRLFGCRLWQTTRLNAK